MSDIGVHIVTDTEGYIAAVGIDTGTDTPAADCSDTAADHMVVGYIVAGYTKNWAISLFVGIIIVLLEIHIIKWKKKEKSVDNSL